MAELVLSAPVRAVPGLMVVVVLAILCLLVLIVFLTYGRLWLRALTSGAGILLTDLIGMTLRGVPVKLVVDTHIRLCKAGVQIGAAPLESHHLAGGDIGRMADWLIAATSIGIDVSWERLAGLDLARELPDIDSLGDGDRRQFVDKLRRGQ